MSDAVPTLFSPERRHAVRQRMRAIQARVEGVGAPHPRYVIADMIEDVIERIGFLRLAPAHALVIGDWTATLSAALAADGADVMRADPAPGPGELALDLERPLPPLARPPGGFALIACLGLLDTVNDLPGALIHLRQALAPGGLMIASMVGAGSLPTLRAVMLAADADRPAPRLHPQIDVRAGGQLLQRAGFVNPVVDNRSLEVRFGTLAALVGDLRAQGLGNVLARHSAVVARGGLARAREAFAAQRVDGRVAERIELLTFSGWAPSVRPSPA